MGPAIVLFAQTAMFWWRHRDADSDEFMTYDSDTEDLIEPVDFEASQSRANEKI